MAKKKDKPYSHLLAIPLCLLIDVILLPLAAYADTAIFSGSEQIGHGAPVVTVIAAVVLGIVTFVVVIVSITRTIRALTKRGR